MRKILDLGLKYLDCEFGLRYILLDLDWKPFGQRLIIILTRYFTGAGLGNTWATNFDYNYYISRDLDFKVPGLRFGFQLLFALLDLDLKILGLRIWITIIKFYWICTWKYLGYDLGLRLI